MCGFFYVRPERALTLGSIPDRWHFVSLTLNQSPGFLAPSALQDAIVFCPDRFYLIILSDYYLT